jgi:hypothetical protein
LLGIEKISKTALPDYQTIGIEITPQAQVILLAHCGGPMNDVSCISCEPE